MTHQRDSVNSLWSKFPEAVLGVSLESPDFLNGSGPSKPNRLNSSHTKTSMFFRCPPKLLTDVRTPHVCVPPSLSHVWPLAIPQAIACQAPLSMGFPRQEYWSGLRFPSPRIYNILEMRSLTVASIWASVRIFYIMTFTILYLMSAFLLGQASPVAQMVKRLSAMQETRAWSLGREDPLEKEMAAHSSILAWKIPWMAEPGRLPSTGLQRVGHNWATSLSLSLFLLGHHDVS